MAARVTGSPGSTRGPRLSAQARKSSILAAARRAFIDNGDVRGTTTRTIAEYAGISEGVIYRHFESKDQLFLEAVVEPLSEAVDNLVAASEIVDRDVRLTEDRQPELLMELYTQLTDALDEMLPLLGLVLFGDPKVAQQFYQERLSVAMDRLAATWQEVGARYGRALPTSDVTVRAVMGISLLLALENHHNPSFDRS